MQNHNDAAWSACTLDPDPKAHAGPSLAVHVLAGLPTEPVREAFAQAGESMPVMRLDALLDAAAGDAVRVGVELPPFAEPSLIVESWEECEFLPYRFGRPAHVAGVSTFVDADRVEAQLASRSALSLHGWGQSARDARTVADIVVGQIESATRLVLVGDVPPSESLSRVLTALNPGATQIRLEANDDRAAFEAVVASRAPASRSARVVPPWLRALQGGDTSSAASGVFVYRRARPFDAARLGAWLARPTSGLVRGKGRVWIASDSARSYGYSCAGSVHRLFAGARWWAACSDGAWPGCPTERERLLERWHPRFGDRRQEIAFVGVDLDPDRLCAELDACLVDASAIDEVDAAAIDEVDAGAIEDHPATPRTSSVRLH